VKAKQKQIKKPVTARAKVAKPSRTRAQKMPIQTRVKRHAKKVLVPHQENQYRPHLIRAHGIIAVLIVALVAQVAYSFASTGHLNVLGRVSDIQTAELLIDTNDERAEEGLSSLQLNDKLSQAAFLKAKNMFAEQYWAHVSPSGVQPWKWFGDVDYNYSFAGENLAKNYPTANATVAAWMHSPTHRANIMNKEYTDIGFAVMDGELNGENTTLVVALYGAPATAAAVKSATNATAAGTFSAAATEGTSPLSYFGSAMSSLSPVTISVLGLLALVAVVGVTAHHYRANLPKAWKKSWRIHHGMFTFVGMIVLGVLIIIATGGGQI